MSNKEAYITFCQSQPALPIFSQPWYLDAVCGAANWEVILIKRGSQIVASWPYYVKQKAFFTYITLPYLTKTMGPYLIPTFRHLKQEHKIFAELIAQLPKVDFFNQDFHASITNWLPFKWAGFQQTTNYSYVIDELQNLDQVFARFSTDYRNNKIKKAQQQVKVVTDRSLRELYDVSKMSFDRQDLSYLLSFDFLQQLDEALVKHKARKMFFAVDANGRIHAALYLIWDQHTSYYLIAGDDPALRQSGASILLVWEAIQFSSRTLGLAHFDFLGSMIPAIERVRRQFGAQQRAFFNLQKYYSPSFRLLESVKAFFSKSYY